jgi:hypothetical protein
MKQRITFLFHERDRLVARFRSLEQSWSTLPVRPVALDSTREIFFGWSELVSEFADMYLDDGEVDQESADELCRLARWLDCRCRALRPPESPSPAALDAAEELRRRVSDLRAAAGGVYSPLLQRTFISLADYGEQVSSEIAAGFRADQIDEYLQWFVDQTQVLLDAEAEE